MLKRITFYEGSKLIRLDGKPQAEIRWDPTADVYDAFLKLVQSDRRYEKKSYGNGGILEFEWDSFHFCRDW